MKTFSMIILAVLLVFAFGCEITDEAEESDGTVDAGDDDDDDAADDDDDFADDDDFTPPEISEATLVVPSEGLPEQLDLQNAANNLDVIMHNGRFYLAFRTAPSHFASELARIYIISSDDQITWDYEAEFHIGTDLREPRLLSMDAGLFCYFAFLGSNPLDFEPGGMMVSEYMGAGDWTDPVQIYGDGFIPWRTKTIDGVPYMLTYVGGGSIYDFNPQPMYVHWLTTEDGYEWTPVIEGQPVVLTGGTSETDFVFLDDGSLIAVSRNEMGDEIGWGSKLCKAAADDLGNWQCVHDPKKYDSPLMFRHGDDVFIIGRRNVTETGYYDLGYDDLSHTIQHLLYELDYWINPKRTALWRVNTVTLEVEWLADFPSKGDTCFPGFVQLSENAYEVYNYTSPIFGPDKPWVLGQLGATQIVRTTVTF